MKSRVSSAPKMETVYTARVKDGRYSNDSPQKHYYGRKGPGFASSGSTFFYKYPFTHIVLNNPQRRPNKHLTHPKSMSRRRSTPKSVRRTSTMTRGKMPKTARPVID